MKLLLGIMVSSKNERKAVINRYLKYFPQDDNLLLVAFTPKDIRWKKRKINVLYFYNNEWNRKWLRFPDGIYNQCFNKHKKRMKKIEKVLGENRIFNTINRFNKWSIYRLLENSKVNKYVPNTYLFGKANVFELLEDHKALFLKPCYGSFSKGIFKIEKTEAGSFSIYQTVTTPKYTFDDPVEFYQKIEELIGKKEFIIQAEIPMKTWNGSRFESRMLLQKDATGKWAVTAGICRITYERSIITNYLKKEMRLRDIMEELDFSADKKNKIMEDLYKISLDTAQCLEDGLGLLGEISVDFAITEDGQVKIIEANGKPSKVLVEDLGDEEIIEAFYKKPMDFLVYLANVKK